MLAHMVFTGGEGKQNNTYNGLYTEQMYLMVTNTWIIYMGFTIKRIYLTRDHYTEQDVYGVPMLLCYRYFKTLVHTLLFSFPEVVH